MRKILLTFLLFVAAYCAALDVPSQSYPSDNAQDMPVQIMFMVNPVTGGTKYQLEIDTAQSMNSPMRQFFDSLTWSPYSQSYYQIVDNLMFGTPHYWRARACSATDTSAWSAIKVVTTTSNTTLKSPADSIVNTDVSVQMVATIVDGCTNYLWEADTTPLFNSVLRKREFSKQYKAASAGYVHKMNNLHFNRRYYWHVAMCNAVDTSDWSEVRWFETVNLPTIIAPADDTTGLDNEVQVAVRKIDGATGYTYQISQSPSFSNPVTLTSFHYEVNRNAYIDTFKTLKYNTKYYWRVRAHHSEDTSNWSIARSFRVTKSAKLYSPANGSEGDIKFQVTLTVQKIAGTTMYIWQMDTTDRFNSSELKKDTSFNWNATQKLYTQFFAGLTYGTTYYWRVKACAPNDTSGWSDVWHFTTICELPNAPALISPSDNDTIVNDTPTLIWHSLANAKKFGLDVAEDSLFAVIVKIESTADTTVTIDGLTASKRYFWRVFGYNDAKRSPYSETRSFYISDGTSAVDDVCREQIIIWPNPTDGVVHLGKKQEITVTDINGHILIQCYGDSVDLRNMPDGIYIVNRTKIIKKHS